MPAMKLLIATRNPHKLDEIRAILPAGSVELVSLDGFPDAPEVEEDGATFEANAVKKAMTLALVTRLWTLADDSGLVVPSLGGEPGVRSARYAGEPVSYQANNEKLLVALRAAADRRARFHCALALASPSGRAQVVEATCPGRIIHELRGAQGFGYDPLFVPDGYEATFAEMNVADKNRISHRALALRKASESWGRMLAGAPSDWPARA